MNLVVDNHKMLSYLALGDLLIVDNEMVFVVGGYNPYRSQPCILISLIGGSENIQLKTNHIPTQICDMFPNSNFQIIKHRDYEFEGKTSDTLLKLKDIIYCGIWKCYFVIENVDGYYSAVKLTDSYSVDDVLWSSHSLEELTTLYKNKKEFYQLKKFDSDNVRLKLFPY